MYVMADGFARLIAPILAVTADQLWTSLPGARDESVHMALFPAVADLEASADEDLSRRWEQLIHVRERVLAEIEPLRKDKQIGSSLQAKVRLTASGDVRDAAAASPRRPASLFIVSQVELEGRGNPRRSVDYGRAAPTATSANGAGATCPVVSSNGICERCQDALREQEAVRS